jgi:hypothetical protein
MRERSWMVKTPDHAFFYDECGQWQEVVVRPGGPDPPPPKL